MENDEEEIDGKRLMQTIKDAMIEIEGSSAYSNDRNRPYDGQPHTDNGLRGKTELKGITMRDVVDCFVKGALLSNGIDQPILYERAEKDTWVNNDIYKLNWGSIDPMAVAKNMTVEIEKMMGIYPNVPQLISIPNHPL